MARGTIELDVVLFDGPSDDDAIVRQLDLVTARYGVAYKIVKLRGSGGGWPIVEFTGPPRALTRLIVDRFDPGDDDELDDLIRIMWTSVKPL